MAFDPSPPLLNAKLDSSDFSNSALRLNVDAPNPRPISLGDDGSSAKEKYTPSQTPQEFVDAKGYNAGVKSVQDLVSESKTKSLRAKTTFNVIAHYDWTLSINKNLLRQEIPYIVLREFKVASSNAMNSLFSTLASVPAMIEENQKNFSAAANAVGSAVKSIDSVNNTLNGVINTSVAQQGIQKVNQLMGSEAVAKSIEKFKTVSAKVSDILTGKGTDSDIDDDDLRRLYAGLYTRKSTGVSYVFPHFTKDWVNIANQFDDSYSASGLHSSIADLMKEVTKMMTTTTSLIEPGVYVQRPQFYNFESSNTNEVADVVFTLYNTVTPDAYVKNKSLIQRFIMQNLPTRHSRVTVEPPCIYEVTIPGKAFFPFCYIRSLNVTHQGTKRVIDGEVVPDAYVVTFQIQSLTSSVNNFYGVEMRNHGLKADRTIDVGSSFTGMINQFKSVVDAATNKVNDTPADVAAKQQATSKSGSRRSNRGGVINDKPPQGDNNGPVDDSRPVIQRSTGGPVLG